MLKAHSTCVLHTLFSSSVNAAHTIALRVVVIVVDNTVVDGQSSGRVHWPVAGQRLYGPVVVDVVDMLVVDVVVPI